MKKIGYIYRYNNNENKGILVYGYNTNVYTPKYLPIKFSSSNCISSIKTGQLVYFDLIDINTASNIERASLQNFKRDVISDLVSNFNSNKWEDGLQKTRIRYENLQNALNLSDYQKESEFFFNTNHRIKLPEDIDGLFALFGNCIQYSYMDSEFIAVNIFDIAFWVDKDVVKSHTYYGMTADQVLDIFDLFVGKEREAYSKYSSREYDKSISPNWNYLLSRLSCDELVEICKKEPMLQPMIPEGFCMKHLDILSIEYGFPSVAVCESFCRAQIKKVGSTTEYLYFENKLNSCIQRSSNKTMVYGVQICEMGEEIAHLLNVQYNNVVLNNVCKDLSSISTRNFNWKERILFLLKENAEYLLKLGLTIDKYKRMLLKQDSVDIIEFVDEYKFLLKEDKEPFKVTVSNWCKEYIIQIANLNYYPDKAWEIYSDLYLFSDFLTETFVGEIKYIVNSEFAILDDLNELKYAYEGKLISEDQYLERYKYLTKDYTLQQLVHEITAIRNFSNEIPLSLQNYLVREIFIKFDFKNLKSYKYVKTANGGISSLEGLVEWLNQQSNLDTKLIREIVKDMT